VIRLLTFFLNRTLNSVIFGISLMVLIAAYIAIGSGVAGVREHFEMDEMQFFSAWPLKVLSVLLVLNLIVVTWIRIPLTPPRYGVWCVHLGIILLVVGMMAHYSLKVEGMALVPVGQRADHYYDRSERMLYTRINGIPGSAHPLPSLPRFKVYSPDLGNEDYLGRDDLRGITPYVYAPDPHTGRPRVRQFSHHFGMDAPLTIDIIGYYPYADIVLDFVEDQTVRNTGLKLAMIDPESGELSEGWLVGSDPAAKRRSVGSAELEHRHMETAAGLKAIREAAERLHRLEVRIGGHQQTMFVDVGGTYRLGETGYTIEVEDFIPAFPMFGTGELVKLLTLKVTTPTQTFRRQVLADRPENQTDFRLNVPGAGPFGQRQQALLDEELQIGYRYSDPYGLLPMQAQEKQTFVTFDEEPGILQIVTGTGLQVEVKQLGGEAKVDLCCPPDGGDPGDSWSRDSRHAEEDHHSRLHVQRLDNLRKREQIEIVPPQKRTRQAGEIGVFQTLLVRVSSGDWSEVVPVPFAQYARMVPWETPKIKVPGTTAELELQLGNTFRGLPARVTLEKFEFVPFPGGDVGSTAKDFRAHLIIEDPETGEPRSAVAHLNNPVYVQGRFWTYFQAAWDPEGQRWTVLGVGNRPAVGIMTTGSVMIFVGLLYAFYVKPIILRKMKEAALAAATQAAPRRGGKHGSRAAALEPVGVASSNGNGHGGNGTVS
jgi:hypothetical protein